MLYNKNNLVISDVCSPNDLRPELNGVLFQRDKTIATDSYVLLQVKNPKEMTDQASELPDTTDKVKPLTNYPKKGYIVPKTAVKKVLSNLPTKTEVPILKNCWFVQSKNPESVAIKTSDLDTTNTVSAKHVDSDYPDISSVEPKNCGHTITIDLKKLKQIVDVLSKMELIDYVKLSIKDANSPLKFTTKTKQEQDVMGLVMPIQS